MVVGSNHVGATPSTRRRSAVEAGSVRPIVGRTHPLADAAEAVRALERGHARGELVVTVEG
jgi:NADPH:quinone reductase-like Zn-dependent oxidoreductase